MIKFLSESAMILALVQYHCLSCGDGISSALTAKISPSSVRIGKITEGSRGQEQDYVPS